MSDAKHTAGPLHVGESPNDSKLYDSYGNRVAAAHDLATNARANAARLALCWNMHDELVAALKDIVEHPAAFSDGANRLWTQAKAALARAGQAVPS